jgi:hypothetical protein
VRTEIRKSKLTWSWEELRRIKELRRVEKRWEEVR